MTKTHRTLILAGALLLASATMLGFSAGRTQAAPTSIAIIDLFGVMEQLDEFKEDEAHIKAMYEGYQKEIDNAVAELNRRQDEIQGLVMTPEENVRAGAGLLEQQAAVEAAKQRSRLILQFNENIRMIDLYQKISDGAREIAEERGYDLVLLRSDEASFGKLPDNAGRDQLKELMVFRQTIFVSDAIDITDALALRLNNKRTLTP